MGIAKLEVDGHFKLDVTPDIIQTAIKQNKTTDDALNYIMDKYPHLIKPNDATQTIQTKQDKEAYKHACRRCKEEKGRTTKARNAKTTTAKTRSTQCNQRCEGQGRKIEFA